MTQLDVTHTCTGSRTVTHVPPSLKARVHPQDNTPRGTLMSELLAAAAAPVPNPPLAHLQINVQLVGQTSAASFQSSPLIVSSYFS